MSFARQSASDFAADGGKKILTFQSHMPSFIYKGKYIMFTEWEMYYIFNEYLRVFCSAVKECNT